MNDMNTLLKAARFSAAKHRDQRRKDTHASPYINHPICVAETLASIGGVEDPSLLAAALLHDTIEDTGTQPEEIEAGFGAEVLSLVLEVTDDKSLPKARRKQLQIDHAPHISSQAKLLKLADKICNIHDILHAPPSDWPLQRKREYLLWTEQVVTGLRGTNSALEQRYDELLAEGKRTFGL
ncbi:MAG: HD domain-containing protein [Chloroflexota bacterium]